MASISYEYNASEFTRNGTDPVTEEEFKSIKQNYDSFLEKFIKKANEDYEKRPNPHRFKWRLFFILLISGGLLLGIDYLLKALGYYDAGEVFAMISFIPFFILVIQPIQYLLASSKGAGGMARYEAKAEMYFDFHASKIKSAKNYADYLQAMSNTSLKEFADFKWTN